LVLRRTKKQCTSAVIIQTTVARTRAGVGLGLRLGLGLGLVLGLGNTTKHNVCCHYTEDCGKD